VPIAANGPITRSKVNDKSRAVECTRRAGKEDDFLRLIFAHTEEAGAFHANRRHGAAIAVSAARRWSLRIEAHAWEP